MKIFTKKEVIPILLIIVSIVTAVLSYNSLPDIVPSHWNAAGEIDGWSSKLFAVVTMPLLILAIYLFMTFIPLLDPLKANYARFENYYFFMKTTFVFIFVVLNMFVLWAGFNQELNISLFMIILFSLFFIALGYILPHIKKNYFVGIRTPWTIHSEEVWDKTHKIGGKLFIASGVISLLGMFILDYAFAIFITTAITAAIISIVYSYFAYRNLGRNK